MVWQGEIMNDTTNKKINTLIVVLGLKPVMQPKIQTPLGKKTLQGLKEVIKAVSEGAFPLITDEEVEEYWKEKI